MKELATVCFIRNRKQPDDYYLRVDNSPEAIIHRLNEQFEYDVELALTFPVYGDDVNSIGFWSMRDAAEWFIIYLKESVATGRKDEPFLHDWYEFHNLNEALIKSAFNTFLSEKREYREKSRLEAMPGKQENLFV